MKHPSISSGTAWKRLFMLAVGLLVAGWLSIAIRDGIKREDLVAVSFGGTHHIGPDFNISQFFVNGTNGFNVGREGGGGRSVCCVFLPKTWRPGLSVDLRWEIGDWTQVNPADPDEDRRMPAFRHFRANVPVEKYEATGKVSVHFFLEGKARVVAGWPVPAELHDDVLPANSHAGSVATVGLPVADMFTMEELDAERRRDEKRREKNGGGWQ
ncbi:MAG: DUF3304 domain-containing protein [Pseudomonadota bacterium]|nr:DUF3304 domain-containing protein [Pseudomonadota bacterium]